MRLVILESPFAGDVEANIAYARACIKDSLAEGEAPIASHLLYTQPGILDDTVPCQRRLGIAAGLEWLRVAEASVVYVDRGISPGMEQGIARAREAGVPVEFRTLGSATPPDPGRLSRSMVDLVSAMCDGRAPTRKIVDIVETIANRLTEMADTIKSALGTDPEEAIALRDAAALLMAQHARIADCEREIAAARLARTHPHGEIGVGDRVEKVSGYRWPGEARAVFTTRAGKIRFVVECTAPEVEGALHIFSGDQIARLASAEA